ncbi:MAG: protein NO VEIN domain-containing protein [Jatrophihabitans sp.]|uniref:protein NO VEIN domain-containing protein n=1 Tax=Jatrophihabitans sp. TaxID=1932789 RepID=UPI003F8094EE
MVFTAALENEPPPWVHDADLLIRDPDDLPTDALRAAEVLGLDPESAHGLLAATWRKVDTSERERVGAAGEATLVAFLSRSLVGQIDHVSLRNDGMGFDVAVIGNCSHIAHLEIKSTTRRRLSIFLSRNEFEVMLRDPLWELVAVRLSADLELREVGTVPRDWVRGNAPIDQDGAARWESARFEVPEDVILPGIPRLCVSGNRI